MPLRDHFHPPLSDQRPWESFHTTWGVCIADLLNREVLPPEYIALEQIHAGTALEIDVGTFTDSASSSRQAETGNIATAVRTVWTPARSPILLPADFPPTCTIEIHATEGGRTLVAAIELVSPGNKDRAIKRRMFAAKCASYLSRGIGLIILDVVTSRSGNLHNEMIELVGWDQSLKMDAEPSLYSVAYRPLRVEEVGRIETWPMALVVGEPLPTMPLSLHADLCLAVDFEAAYQEACQRRRLDEIA